MPTRTRQRCNVGTAGLISATLALVATGQVAPAASIVLEPTSTGTRTVAGGGESLLPGGATLLNSFDGRSRTLVDSAILFDLSPILAGPVAIDSATFSFTVSGAQTVIDRPDLAVSSYVGDGAVVDLAAFAGPSTPVGTTGVLPDSATPTGLSLPFTFDVTAYIRSLVAEAGRFPGFRTDVTGTSNVFIYGVGSSGSPENPHLTISVSSVPEPSGAISLALGMAGAAIVAWRQRAR